jgi:hypothetical protein
MAGPILTINGLTLERDGFCAGRDLTDLFREGEHRGEDFIANGVQGQTFRPKVRDAHIALCSFLVFGRNGPTGTAHPDRWSGIEANLQTIRTATIAASRSALVSASLALPNGSTRTGQVYCPRLDVGLHEEDLSGAAVIAVLEVVIPSGALT